MHTDYKVAAGVQCQIDQVFDRAGSLLEALSVDSKGLDMIKVEEAGIAIEEYVRPSPWLFKVSP